jgi:putative membrane protein
MNGLTIVAFLAWSGDHWQGWHGGAWGAWGWLWAVLILVLLGGVAALVAWLVVRGTRQADRTGSGAARAILAERFARGELTGEEYRERLDQLR